MLSCATHLKHDIFVQKLLEELIKLMRTNRVLQRLVAEMELLAGFALQSQNPSP
jgi:hypothetical protein